MPPTTSNPLHCPTCNSTFKDTKAITQHIAGQKHIMDVKTAAASLASSSSSSSATCKPSTIDPSTISISELLPWKCYVCNITCGDQTSAVQHMAGKKHARAVAKQAALACIPSPTATSSSSSSSSPCSSRSATPRPAYSNTMNALSKGYHTLAKALQNHSLSPSSHIKHIHQSSITDQCSPFTINKLRLHFPQLPSHPPSPSFLLLLIIIILLIIISTSYPSNHSYPYPHQSI